MGSRGQFRRCSPARAASARPPSGSSAISRCHRRPARSASPVSAAAAAASNSASGRSGPRPERRVGFGARRRRVAEVAERRGQQRARQRVFGVGGDRPCEGRPRGRPVGLGRLGAGAQDQPVVVRRGDAVGLVDRRGGEVGAAGGEPLARGVAEDDGPEVGGHRAVRVLGEPGQDQRGGAVRAERGERLGLAETRRHAAAGPRPERRLLAGGRRVGGDGGGAGVGRADLGGGRQRREGEDEERRRRMGGAW